MSETRITGFMNETDAKALAEEFKGTEFAHITETIKTAKDVPLLTILFKDFHNGSY